MRGPNLYDAAFYLGEIERLTAVINSPVSEPVRLQAITHKEAAKAHLAELNGEGPVGFKW